MGAAGFFRADGRHLAGTGGFWRLAKGAPYRAGEAVRDVLGYFEENREAIST